MLKNLPASAGDFRDMGSISESGGSPGVGNGNPLQYSCLENSMDRGAWQPTVHGVAKSQTWLSMHVWSLYTYFIERFLSWMDSRFLSDAFNASVEMIIWFLFFNLLMRYITLTHWWMFNHLCSCCTHSLKDRLGQVVDCNLTEMVGQHLWGWEKSSIGSICFLEIVHVLFLSLLPEYVNWWQWQCF